MMDYCDSDVEKAKNPNAKDWFRAIANGDQAAFEFMWRFWNFTHVYDDLVDKDKPVTVAIAAKEVAAFVHTISFNPFYIRFKDSLFPLILQVCNRWIDGDELDKSEDERDRILSEAVRCGDIDLMMHVAYLVGGWEHMRRMNGVRSYDKGEQNVQ